MRSFARIYGEITYILTLAVLLISSSLLVPRLFGITPYIVQSGSMAPLIETGSVAFINTKDTNAGVGDIVTFRIGDEGSAVLVTHRIVRKNADGTMTTKGDANDTADITSVTPGQVIGTYVMSVPKIGYLLSGMNRAKILIVAGFVILLNVSSRIIDIILEEGYEELTE